MIKSPTIRVRVNPETSVQLAPAAGAGIGKLIADALLADPEFIPLMKAAFVGALKAEIHFYDRESKSWESRPDDRIRLQAVMGCLAHMEGEPVKRIIHQHMTNGVIDPLAALKESPAAREAMRRLLEKAEWRHSGQSESKRPKTAQPVDVEL